MIFQNRTKRSESILFLFFILVPPCEVREIRVMVPV